MDDDVIITTQYNIFWKMVVWTRPKKRCLDEYMVKRRETEME